MRTRNHWQVKHGMAGTRIYKTWQNMKSRCNNPNASKYYLYGGKGIKVCNEWNDDFNIFYEWATNNGYTDDLTLDRVDGNKDYCPENCRWATYKQQANNTTQNHLLSFNGETHSIYEWAEMVGLSKKCLSERIRRGWTIERALTTPTIRFENFGNFIKERKKVKNV